MNSSSLQHDSLLDDSDSSFEKHLRGLRIRNDSEDHAIETKQDDDAKDKQAYNLDEDDDSLSGNEEGVDNVDKDSCWKLDRRTKEYFLRNKTSTTSNPTVVSWPDLRVPVCIFDKLYDHQKVGVQWMGTLHEKGIGGILGDDMGMGKTFMTLTYLGGLMRAKTIRNALVVAPLSVLRSWEKEAQRVLVDCVPRVRIVVVSSELPKYQRSRMLEKALLCRSSDPYLIISTYGLVRESTMDFVNDASPWDYVCLDEGHTIKNPKAETSVRCRRICGGATRRLMLTGTPILNNLKELWSLFDWATSGRVLGNLKTFSQYYAKPIEGARDKNASAGVMQLGQRVNTELQTLLQPYFLQRMKIDFLKDKLPPKSDYVVWTHLSDTQRRMYEEFLNSGKVKSILSKENTSVLEAITWLKKLCGHPRLANQTPANTESFLTLDEEQTIIQDSAKLGVLVDLVRWLREGGHRTLIFSQSTKMLDMMQSVLSFVSVARIDGSTIGRDRQRVVDDFNDEDSGIDALLLSTKAAGVGLTLTGADRVIVYDPSWTPAEDSQAVDRCYRIGQTRPVVVYRLIAAGTIEEKTYEKQVHKDGIRRTVFTQATDIQRYFDHNELSRMFALAPRGVCEIMQRVQQVQEDWSQHGFVLSQSGVVGLSRHDGFYAKPSTDVDTDEMEASQTAFGSLAPEEPKRVLGRAQRVLQSENASVVPARQNRDKPSIVRGLINQDGPAVAKSVHVPQEVVDVDEDDEIVVVDQANMISSSSRQESQPRRHFQDLLNVLEHDYATLNKDEKMAVHQAISTAAQNHSLLS